MIVVMIKFPRRGLDAKVTLPACVRRMNETPVRTRTSVDRRKLLNARTLLDDLGIGQ